MTIDSPYLFDNLEPIDQLHAKPVKLIQKTFHQNSRIVSIIPIPKALTALMLYGIALHN